MEPQMMTEDEDFYMFCTLLAAFCDGEDEHTNIVNAASTKDLPVGSSLDSMKKNEDTKANAIMKRTTRDSNQSSTGSSTPKRSICPASSCAPRCVVGPPPLEGTTYDNIGRNSALTPLPFVSDDLGGKCQSKKHQSHFEFTSFKERSSSSADKRESSQHGSGIVQERTSTTKGSSSFCTIWHVLMEHEQHSSVDDPRSYSPLSPLPCNVGEDDNSEFLHEYDTDLESSSESSDYHHVCSDNEKEQDRSSFDCTSAKTVQTSEAVSPNVVTVDARASQSPCSQGKDQEQDEISSTKYEIGPDDVVLGRGYCYNNLPGNQRFRELIRSRMHVYHAHPSSSVSGTSKAQVSEEVVAEIHRRGGCFLERSKGSTKECAISDDAATKGATEPRNNNTTSRKLEETTWRVVKKEVARKKVSQRFRWEKLQTVKSNKKLGLK